MTKVIKAIDTTYNGYRFRSRLEARWAVFFDTLHVEYRYEAEGFELATGWYLPDFFMPEWEAFVEIKPTAPDAGEIAKCRALRDASGHQVILLYGEVWPGRHRARWWQAGFDGDWTFDDVEMESFAECRGSRNHPFCEGIYLYSSDAGCGSVYDPCDTDKWPLPCDEIGNFYTPRLNVAYAAARAARFEHGVKGVR